MLLTIAIDERPVIEVSLGHGFAFTAGGWDFVLHRPGGREPFSWETTRRDLVLELGSGRPMRCRKTLVHWGAWEIVWRRTYPVPGTVGVNRSVDDEGNLRPTRFCE